VAAERFDFYRKLIRARQKSVALQSANMESVAVQQAVTVMAFRRWHADEQFLVLINLADAPAVARVDLGKAHASRRLTDVLSGWSVHAKKKAGLISIPMEAYSVRWVYLE
jgi:glycosidase